MSTPLVAEDTATCPQDYGLAVLEIDGDTAVFVCTVCESEFGHRRVSQDSTCQVGIPEEVRRRFTPAQPEPVFLGTIGRRPSE